MDSSKEITLDMDDDNLERSMNEPGQSLDEKLQLLQERAKEIAAFVSTLSNLKHKLEKKKMTIKEIIEKKIEDNIKELNKWKEILFMVVDESLNEKIEKLVSQEQFFQTTQKEIDQIVESTKNGTVKEDESDSESEEPKIDDLLALELRLNPEGLTPAETTEIESVIKKEFSILLNEPKKSLRRTFAYVGGIIRGYLRRGKVNVDWISIMRKLEGREYEESSISETDPYIGTKLSSDDPKFILVPPINVSKTWESVCKLFQNRNNLANRSDFCLELGAYYETNPEDVQFYLPQLIYLLLNQYNKENEFHQLKTLILGKCAHSIHFGLQTYLLVRAAKDSRAPPKKKKLIPPSIIKWRVLCDSLLNEIQQVVSSSTQKEREFEEVFKIPIRFMDNLVGVSKYLYENTPPEHYATELKKKLKEENETLQKLPPESEKGPFVYVPLLKPVGSADHHRVCRIPEEEAYPIPTYNRVLYHVLLEVIDSKPKKKKKKKDKENAKDSSSDKEKPETTNEKPEKPEKPEKIDKVEKYDKNLENSPLNSDDETDKKKKKKREKKEKSIITSSDASKLFTNSILLGNHQEFGELWEKKTKRIQQESPYGNIPNWRIQSLIVKYGDEALQEEFAMQLLVQFQRIFLETGLSAKIIPYRILAISSKSSLIEPIPNSLSLDTLKKKHTNLLNFFVQAFGDPSEPTFKQAQQNFVKTMAGYSIICYLLQIKDRHNGNILLDASGHIIHIDFGYFLAKTITFEKAPFKLTTEFVEVMGGHNSPCYRQYCRLCVKTFLACRKHYEKIMLLVEMTMEGKGKKVLPCLRTKTGTANILEDIKERFHLDWTEEKCEEYVLELIEEARGSWRTVVYDAYQLILNNIH